MKREPIRSNDLVSLIELAEELDATGQGGGYSCDWWFVYFSARIALRNLALRAINVTSEDGDSHPDRASMDFKQVSNDINDDMQTILDPDYKSVPCPKCGELVHDPTNCIVCFVRERRPDL